MFETKQHEYLFQEELLSDFRFDANRIFQKVAFIVLSNSSRKLHCWLLSLIAESNITLLTMGLCIAFITICLFKYRFITSDSKSAFK
mgnify:CR=1 FL=1